MNRVGVRDGASSSEIDPGGAMSHTYRNVIKGFSARLSDAAAVNGNASFSTIRTWLVNNATNNVITGNPAGTPNKLLFKSTF